MIQTPTEYRFKLVREIKLLELEIIGYANTYARLLRDGHNAWNIGHKINLLNDEMSRKTIDLLQH